VIGASNLTLSNSGLSVLKLYKIYQIY
jgi:hypothetical protein